jgi:hypothetical protein
MTEKNNIQPISRMKTRIMRRVRIIHILQSSVTTTVLSIGIFVLALWGVGREVWVSRVFQNMPSLTNYSAVLHFYLAAFLDTRFIVQVLSILTLGAFVWLAYNVSRTVQEIRFA